MVFPRRAKKPKAGDSSKEELAAVQQAKGALLPIAHAAPAAELETVKITEEMQARLPPLRRPLPLPCTTSLRADRRRPAAEWPLAAAQAFRAYYKLRLERTNKKHLGKRAKRAAEAAAEEKDKAK